MPFGSESTGDRSGLVDICGIRNRVTNAFRQRVHRGRAKGMLIAIDCPFESPMPFGSESTGDCVILK